MPLPAVSQRSSTGATGGAAAAVTALPGRGRPGCSGSGNPPHSAGRTSTSPGMHCPYGMCVSTATVERGRSRRWTSRSGRDRLPRRRLPKAAAGARCGSRQSTARVINRLPGCRYDRPYERSRGFAQVAVARGVDVQQLHHRLPDERRVPLSREYALPSPSAGLWLGRSALRGRHSWPTERL